MAPTVSTEDARARFGDVEERALPALRQRARRGAEAGASALPLAPRRGPAPSRSAAGSAGWRAAGVAREGLARQRAVVPGRFYLVIDLPRNSILPSASQRPGRRFYIKLNDE